MLHIAHDRIPSLYKTIIIFLCIYLCRIFLKNLFVNGRVCCFSWLLLLIMPHDVMPTSPQGLARNSSGNIPGVGLMGRAYGNFIFSLAWWWDACLASAEPWVWSSAQKQNQQTKRTPSSPAQREISERNSQPAEPVTVNCCICCKCDPSLVACTEKWPLWGYGGTADQFPGLPYLISKRTTCMLPSYLCLFVLVYWSFVCCPREAPRDYMHSGRGWRWESLIPQVSCAHQF